MWFKEETRKIVEAHHEAPIIHPAKRHLGIILTIAGYLFLAIDTIFFQVEAFSKQALNSFYAIFFEFTVLHFIMFLTFLVFCLSQGKSYFRCNKPGYVLLRGVIGVAALFFYSLARIWSSNVDNSMLYSTDAFWLVFILFLITTLPSKGVWIGILLGTAGVLFIYSLDFSSVSDIIGGTFGTIAGFLLAVIIFLTRYMVRRDPPLRIGFYNSLIGLGVFFIGTVSCGFLESWGLPSSSAILLMTISGFIWALALFFFLEAFYFTENHIIGSIGLFLPIFTEVFNWAINNKTFSLATFIGLLVMGSGALIVIISTYRHDKKNPKNGTGSKQYKIPEIIDSE